MTTLNIRKIDGHVAGRLKLAAHSRGLTLGQYLAALLQLHDAMRARADAGDDNLQLELETLGLNTAHM